MEPDCPPKSVRRERGNALVAFIRKYGSCFHCGCKDNLTFHHRVPSEKKHSVGSIQGRTFEALKREIAKCDILCRTCHDIVHNCMPSQKPRKKKHPLNLCRGVEKYKAFHGGQWYPFKDLAEMLKLPYRFQGNGSRKKLPYRIPGVIGPQNPYGG